MAALREFWRRLRGVLRRNPADHDLERELRFHLELAEEELRGQGHSRAEAARMARVRLGGVPQALEALRDQRGLPWLDDLRTDVRIGLRGLARRPAFAATAALTLSVGIGTTAAVATWTNGLLFQPLPVPDPEELVMVAQLDEHTAEFPHELSYPEYLDYREGSDVFEGLAAFTMAEGLLSIDGRAAERIRVEYVSDNYFDVLQLDAELGRTFLAGEGLRPGDAPFVVLTHHAWQTRFGGDATVLGKAVRLGRASMTVIGITPEPFAGVNGFVPVEAFVAATEAALVEPGWRWTELLTDRREESFFLTGRLRPGVTFAEAAAQLDVLAAALAAEHPESRHSELYVVSERDSRPYLGASRHIAPLMTAVMGLASLVLLIAVANVGTLLVGRGIARRQEMALRAGLGATRRRLVRQLTTESVLVALVGGAGGVLVALWAADLVAARAATELARSMPVRDLPMDWRIFGFTAAVAIVAGLLAGLAPALRSTRIDLARAIGSGGRGTGAGSPGRRLTNGLVVVQVAVSMLLLVCAGLFVQSSRNADATDFGFRIDDLLVLSVDPLAQGYDRDQARALYREIAAEVGALPGVRSASWARRA
ncbi:MAG: ABC transporter permease, partial [Acidobacteria bacterium]|nr:ABC transporter permease [Acidobacteriota bacterium]